MVANFTFYFIKGKDSYRWMFANKFQVLITIGTNSLTFSKVLYDTITIDKLNLITF